MEEVGLRSTRIRTGDRTVVSLPNGQIANMKLETLSARDRFLFIPWSACAMKLLQASCIRSWLRFATY